MEPEDKYFLLDNNPIYNTTVFSRFFEENDPAVMKWAENVLAKVSGAGILPKFIEKGGEDFQAFWGTITHLFALIVLYARKYKEINTNQILFELFIENRGLISNLVTSQEQMEYLFYNYIEEYNKRGRLDIINKEGIILGELLRLIRYNNLDEFIFALLRPQDVSWTIGYSSPCWKRTNTVMNVIKGYEFTESIISLDNYPLLRSSNINVINDLNDDGELISSMIFSGVQKVGLSPVEGDTSKLLIVDPALNYEISIRAKVSSLINSKVQFGVVCYDKDYNIIGTQYIENGEYQLSADSLFHTTEYLEFLLDNIYYNLTGVLLAYNERNYDAVKLNFPSGRALSFLPETKFICPVFVQNRESNDDPNVFLYDVKVKPLELPFQQGYLGGKNVIAAYYKNNAFQTDNSIVSFIKQYLISYKNIFGSISIKDKDIHKVTFKLFSERNNYIQNATITIAGQTLKTDINGEVSIELYPGSYVCSVEKEDFDSQEDVVLVEDVDYIKYIQLKGKVYQRTVSFLVLDEDGNFLSGARVNFNEQTQITGDNGLVLFEAFPGLYTYTVEKYDYISVSNTISVTDSMSIRVEMKKVSYYTVAVRVRENLLPIPDAAVVLTGDFDGSGTQQQYVGTTNEQGIANQTQDGNPFLMRAGTYHYLVSKKDFFTKEADFNVLNNATVNVDLVSIPYFKVNFTVLRDNVPVEGASINIDGNTLLTDNKGKASISLANGEYDYTITKVGYIEKSGSVVVNNLDQDIVENVTAIEYTLTFSVTNTSGNLLIGATITIGTENQITSALGIATFKRISGEYNYSITLNGYNPYTGSVKVEGENIPINVQMSDVQYTVRFVVRNNGEPVENASVKCGDRDALMTNRNGEAVFSFASGTYPYTITKEGFESYSSNVEVRDRNTVVPVDLTLASSIVTFHVTDFNTDNPISNAAIVINNEVHYTTEEGIASFLLPYGDYHYTVEMDGYNYNWGDVRITEEPQTVNIQMIENETSVYPLTFTVNQESSLISGALVKVNDNILGITDSNGIVSFNLPNGNYSYEVSNGEFINSVSGQQEISNSGANVSINLTRKTTNVTFVTTYIPDPTDPSTKLPVQDVAVTFNGSTEKTNSQGIAIFSNVPLSSDVKQYTCSKKPPYEDIVRVVSITTENPQIDVTMGESTYSITFTVVDELGNPISGAYVTCGGQTGTTNPESSQEPGRLTLRGYSNNADGYYYTISKEGYQTVSGNVVVFNNPVFVTGTLKKSYTEVIFKVQTSNGLPLQGASIRIDDLNEATNIYGEVSFLLTEQKTYNYLATYPHCMSSEGSFVNDLTPKTITVTIEDTMAIVLKYTSTSTTNVRLPIHNTSQDGLSNLKVDWGDGTITYGQTLKQGIDLTNEVEIKISFGSEVGTLKWGEERSTLTGGIKSMLRRVERFFQNTNKIEFQAGGFYNCYRLSYIDKLRVGFVTGTAENLFTYCHALTSIYPDIFDWTYLGEFSECFAYSGITQVDADLFANVSVVTSCRSMFMNCTELTSVSNFYIHGQCRNCAEMFAGCPNLRSVNSDIFKKASNVTTAKQMFYSDSSLTETPDLSLLTGVVSCEEMFSYSGVQNVVNSGFPPNCSNANGMFLGSELSLSNSSLNISSSYLTTLTNTFFDCENLGNLSKISLNCTNVTTVQSLFAGSNVNSVPANYFSKLGKCVNFTSVFQNCKNLQYIYGEKDTSPFYNCPAETVRSAFSGCTNLQGDIQYLFFSSCRKSRAGISWILIGVSKYCSDYRDCFRGCTSLKGYSCTSQVLTDSIDYTIGLHMFKSDFPIAETATLFPELINSKHGGCYNGCTKLNDYAYISAYYSDWL